MDTKVKCPKCGEAHWQNEAHECATNTDDSSKKKTKRAGGWTTGDSSDLGCALDAGCCLGELLTGCVVPLIVISIVVLTHVFLPPRHAHGQAVQSPRKVQTTPLVLSLANSNAIPDVFSARFISDVRKAVASELPASKSSSLLKCYSGEGMRWTISGDDSLLEHYLKLPEGTPGRHRAEEFLEEQGDPDGTLSRIEKDRFTQLIARTYFSAWRTAIGQRGVYQGGRFASVPPKPVSLGMADALK